MEGILGVNNWKLISVDIFWLKNKFCKEFILKWIMERVMIKKEWQIKFLEYWNNLCGIYCVK